MRNVSAWFNALIPIVVALGAAAATTAAWLHGVTVLGVALPVPTNTDDWSKVLSFSFGIPAGVLALFTYSRAFVEQQRTNLWKRREYLVARFDRLELLDPCKAAMRLLDYNATYIALDGLRGQVVHDGLVMSALAPHQLRGGYTPEEQVIRDAFDTFFNELDRIGAMADAQLVDFEDLRPYTDYWLKLFDPNERGRPPAFGAILRRYVRVFHYNALATLLHARGLMAIHEPHATTEARADDALIAAFDPTWVAPASLDWTQRIELVEASS